MFISKFENFKPKQINKQINLLKIFFMFEYKIQHNMTVNFFKGFFIEINYYLCKKKKSAYLFYFVNESTIYCK